MANSKVMEGELPVERFDVGHTLGSGQVFRWGRDTDGWWKGVAYGTVFHLRQEEDILFYRASRDIIETYEGAMPETTFLRWYLRLDERPRIRVPASDEKLRRAREKLRGFRFVRQEPFECIISYVLSAQARMQLTKQRINLVARLRGAQIDFAGERAWAFPDPPLLADLNEGYFRKLRFGWRSEWVSNVARIVEERLAEAGEGPREAESLEQWREAADELREIPRTGIGLKVSKCIDLFGLDRMGAVPVDTWVRKLAEDWYGVGGTDAAICRWAEERGGKWAGYMNEYLFIYYRELNSSVIHDRVLTFSKTDLPSQELPVKKL